MPVEHVLSGVPGGWLELPPPPRYPLVITQARSIFITNVHHWHDSCPRDITSHPGRQQEGEMEKARESVCECALDVP